MTLVLSDCGLNHTFLGLPDDNMPTTAVSDNTPTYPGEGISAPEVFVLAYG
jgi:hypothetical protein